MKKLRYSPKTGNFGHKKSTFGPAIELIFQSSTPEKSKSIVKDPSGCDIYCYYWRVQHEGEMKWFVTANKILVRDLLEYVVPMETTTIRTSRFCHGRSNIWYMGRVNDNPPGGSRRHY